MRGILLADDKNIPAVLRPPHTVVSGKPIAYYSLCALVAAGARDIIVMARPDTVAAWQKLLGGGAQWGINLSYALHAPVDTTTTLLFAAEFLGDHSVVVASRMYIINTHRIAGRVDAAAEKKGATVFVRAAGESEVPGLAFYDATATARARKIASPAAADKKLQQSYAAQGGLDVQPLAADAALELCKSHTLAEVEEFIKRANHRGEELGSPEKFARAN